MNRSEIIGAFGEGDAARLTGLTIGQLRSWDRTKLLQPSYSVTDARSPYSRVYSFRDIVSLRVLASLRIQHGVSVQHLRKVSAGLAHLGDDRWIATTLYVLGRRVVFDDPQTLTRQEVVSGQQVFDIPLKVAVRNTREAILALNERSDPTIGRIVQDRFVMNNRPVFDGTRIPISAVIAYLERGIPVHEILREFPELREGDVTEARSHLQAAAA